jgi:hypothetical protein
VARLVRGSTDRLALDWSGTHGLAPSGQTYSLSSEQVRGEPRFYWYETRSAFGHGVTERSRMLDECPYDGGTLAQARRMAEWFAWVDAGRPAADASSNFGRCGDCGRRVGVRSDGTARRHRRGSKPSRPCFGSGKPTIQGDR